jgi:hypothetical protein
MNVNYSRRAGSEKLTVAPSRFLFPAGHRLAVFGSANVGKKPYSTQEFEWLFLQAPLQLIDKQ